MFVNPPRLHPHSPPGRLERFGGISSTDERMRGGRPAPALLTNKETHTMDYAVTNPATGETVKTYDTITDAELKAAIAAADEAHRTWSKSTTVEEHAALIRRVSELHTERRQELAELIVREMGKPIKHAL